MEKKRILAISFLSLFIVAIVGNVSAYSESYESDYRILDSDTEDLELNPLFINPSIEADMGLNKLISEGYSGKNVTIAILDTGIMYNDLRFDRDGSPLTIDDRVVTNHVSFISGEADYDLNGHGTTIAGLIAAQECYIPSIDFEFAGISNDVELWSVKVLDKDGYGDEISITRGLEYCLEHSDEIDIINLSFGLIKDATNADILDQIEDLAIRCWESGMIVVAAAGNDGDALRSEGVPLYSISAPSSALEVISVGAIMDGGVADFSSIGPAPINDYVKPDLVAPGANLITTYHQNGSYAVGVQGTSYSAPIIAGGIAILLEAMEKNTTPDLVKASLEDSCTSLGYVFYEEGAGIPNFTKALEFMQSDDYNGICVYPEKIDFPNFFDPEKESVPQNTHDLYPEINFEKILVTLIVAKETEGISFVVDQEIDKFIKIDDISISEKGQYAVGVDFVEAMFIEGSAFVFTPGFYEGYVRIYSGELEVDSIYITVSISFLGLFKVWWGLILGLFVPFLSLLAVYKKKKPKKKPMTLIRECPNKNQKNCYCEVDGSRCYVKNTP